MSNNVEPSTSDLDDSEPPVGQFSDPEIDEELEDSEPAEDHTEGEVAKEFTNLTVTPPKEPKARVKVPFGANVPNFNQPKEVVPETPPMNKEPGRGKSRWRLEQPWLDQVVKDSVPVQVRSSIDTGFNPIPVSRSSLIYILAGFFRYDSGTVRLGDEQVTAEELSLLESLISRDPSVSQERVLSIFEAKEAAMVSKSTPIEVYNRPFTEDAFKDPLVWTSAPGTQRERDEAIKGYNASTKPILEQKLPSEPLKEFSPREVTKFVAAWANYAHAVREAGYVVALCSPLVRVSEEIRKEADDLKLVSSCPVYTSGLFLEHLAYRMRRFASVEAWFVINQGF